MSFIVLTVHNAPLYADILIAELSEVGFDSFLENEDSFQGCIDKIRFSESAVHDVMSRYEILMPDLIYTHEEVEKINWNEEWEKNYDPIVISDLCIVRASFHKPQKHYRHEIVVNPKMSFGTGHHETTFLMLKNQLNISHEGMKVFDVGCGTGILAIMAHHLGAKEIKACDIDEWCVENSTENFKINNCGQISCYHGTFSSIPLHDKQDLILANINRNVLLEEIPLYSSKLKENGKLLLSGFYEKDIADIAKLAKKNDLQSEHYETKKDWAVVLFKKLA